MNRTILPLLLLAGMLGFNTLVAQTARLQVIHNSPTPTVDIYLDGTNLLDDFAYRTASGFVDAPADTEINVGVALSTSTSAADTLVNFPLTLEDGKTYIAIAGGIVGDTVTPFTLFITDMGQEAAADTGVDFAVHHGSTDAPAVDVAARGVATLVENASFGAITDYLNVPAAPYIIDIKVAGTETIAASYDVDLSGLEGGAAVVFASGFLSPGENDPAFGLFAALSDGTVVSFADTSLARLQVIHNSPQPIVDIYLNGGILLDDFEFRTASEFIDAPAGVGLDVGVALSNSTSAADTIVNFPLTLENGKTYVAIAGGVVGDMETPFTLFITDMGQEAASSDSTVAFAVHHGAPDVTGVDVDARGVATLVEGANYGDITAYLEVPAAQYFLDIRPAGQDIIVTTLDADLSGLGGGAAVVFASGFLNPEGAEPGFGLFAALPNGDVVEFMPTSIARLQVIHNSPSPTVDVYLNGDVLIDDFEYRTATPFINAPADTPLDIGVALSTSMSAADTLVNFGISLEANKTYIAFAGGIVGDTTTPFTLFITDMGQEAAAATGVDFLVHHGATDAPAVDVIARDVSPLVSGATYGAITGYTSVPAASYTLDITPAGEETIVASFTADLSGLEGGAAAVFASGFLTPGENDPAFGLFAALPDGTVVPFPAFTTSIDDITIDNRLLKLFPNPATSSIQIDLEAFDQPASEISLYMLDMQGRVVKTIDSFVGNRTEIAVSDLPTGIYAVVVQAENVRAVRKVEILNR
ncbi:MAG: DUF4397 domain-containing protein [Bacteroidota bacterium]